jgi:outer membrane biosynthesis protein TonB
MTAAMRAAAGEPRANRLPTLDREPSQALTRLRVGLVVAGCLVQERLFERGTRVTVGRDERATFVVEAEGIPERFVLFERVGPDYCIHFLDGMTGRLEVDDGIHDLEALRARADRSRDGYRLRLPDHARGRLVLGDTTLLFQLVEPPPRPHRPQLPPAARGAFAGPIDWTMTVLVAISFLLHFGFVGAMYSDWMDPVVDADVTAGWLELARKAVPAPVETREVTEAPTQVDETPVEPTPSSPSTSAPHERPAAPESAEPRRDRPPAPNSDPEHVSQLLRELERLHIGVVAGAGAGPHLDEVLRDDPGPVLDLDVFARGSAAPGDRTGGLDLPAAEGPIHPGETPGLERLRGRVTAPMSSTAGTAQRVAPAPLDVKYTAPWISAPISDAEAVIRTKIHPRARLCYQKGLDADPTQEGRVEILIQVAPNGEVASVSVVSNAGLSSDVAKCITAAAHGVTFAAPGAGSGSGSMVRVPFIFRRAGAGGR